MIRTIQVLVAMAALLLVFMAVQHARIRARQQPLASTPPHAQEHRAVSDP
jgi:hypothetical protein